MKTVIKILLWILGIIILILMIGFVLPAGYKVERSITIGSKPHVVFGLTGYLSRWDLWTPWNSEYDSTAVFELTGDDGQPGAIRKWSGKLVGEGQMALTIIKPDSLITYDLSFDDGAYRSVGIIAIENRGDSVKVTWSDEGNMGYNPIDRYFGLLMDNFMGPDFERGLARLKEIAEERADWPAILEKRSEDLSALLIRDSAGPETYGIVLGKAYGEIMAFIESRRINIAGSPFAVYLTWDSSTMRSTMDIGVPVVNVSEPIKQAGRIRFGKIPAQEVVMSSHFGPYDQTARVYYIIEQYIRESGLSVTGSPWEVYVTDPMTEKDTANWQTDIYFPVKRKGKISYN